MKGPEYHETKRRMAKEQLGISLFDLWEDEIITDAFESKVQNIINYRLIEMDGSIG